MQLGFVERGIEMATETVEELCTPLYLYPEHLGSCGTMFRGCDPQCPKYWFKEGARALVAVAKHQLTGLADSWGDK